MNRITIVLNDVVLKDCDKIAEDRSWSRKQTIEYLVEKLGKELAQSIV